MKVIDSIIFSTEIDLLKIRLAYYNDVVDEFVICESNKNFYGEDRDLVFPTIKDQLGEYAHKITYLMCDTFDYYEKKEYPGGIGPWRNEEILREYQHTRFKDASDDDIIIFSDADEFYAKHLIQEREKPLSCLSHVSYFFTDYVQFEPGNPPPRNRAIGPQMFQRKQYKNLEGGVFSQFASNYSSFQSMRHNPLAGYKEISQGEAWHLSYLNFKESIPRKLSSFSHSELLYLKDYPISYFEDKIKNKEDIFGRDFSYRIEQLLPDDLDVLFGDSYKYNL